MLYYTCIRKSSKERISTMKEKTFKDLGLDEGEKYIKKISSEFDLSELENVLENKYEEKEIDRKIKEIKEQI